MRKTHTLNLVLILLGTLSSVPSYAETVTSSSPPEWFKGELTSCIEKLGGGKKVMGYLELDYATGGSVTISGSDKSINFTFPGIGMDKRKNPGAGGCCLFDSKGDILDARMEMNGNEGCNSWRTKQKAPHSGIYWCVGPQANCFMDWWYDGKEVDINGKI